MKENPAVYYSLNRLGEGWGVEGESCSLLFPTQAGGGGVEGESCSLLFPTQAGRGLGG